MVCGREPNANATIYLLSHWSLCINGYFSCVPDPNWDVFCDSWNLQLVILIQLRRRISPHGRWHPVPLFSLMAVAFSTCWGHHLFSVSRELLWAEYCGAFERLSYHRAPCWVWLQGPWFSIRRARPLKAAVRRAVRGQPLTGALWGNTPNSGGRWSWVSVFNTHAESQRTANNAIETLSKAWLKTTHTLVPCVRPGMLWEATTGMNTLTNDILLMSSAYWRVKAMKPEMLKRLILFSATVKLEICQHCVLPRWQRQLACSYLLASSQRPSAFLKDYYL